MLNYIVDTSVVVKWFDQEREQHVERALNLFKQMMTGTIRVCSVDLLYYELANALIKGKRRPAKIVYQHLEDLEKLPLRIVAYSMTLMRNALEMAEQYNLTVYDAIFVATAKLENGILVTDNPKHQGRDSKINVMAIKDYPVETNTEKVEED